MREDEPSAEPNDQRRRRHDPVDIAILESIFEAMLEMEEPLRERWVAAMKADQYGFRRIDPDRDLDPYKMQVYLTDEGEFSSILVPIPATKRRWRIWRRRDG